jgi:hypothetical protein
MKPAATILAASVLAVLPFWLAGPAAAVPIGVGLGPEDAARSDVETVRAVVVGRAGAAGRVGGVVGGGRNVGVGRPGAGWAGGPAGWRPGYGVATGALVGGAIASQPWNGYGYANGYDNGYGYDGGPGYYGYGAGYPAGYDTPAATYGYGGPAYGGYPYGPPPGDAYLQSCTYVGGPKSADWVCR